MALDGIINICFFLILEFKCNSFSDVECIFDVMPLNRLHHGDIEYALLERLVSHQSCPSTNKCYLCSHASISVCCILSVKTTVFWIIRIVEKLLERMTAK